MTRSVRLLMLVQLLILTVAVGVLTQSARLSSQRSAPATSVDIVLSAADITTAARRTAVVARPTPAKPAPAKPRVTERSPARVRATTQAPRTVRVARPPVPQSTAQQRMEQAVARIPGYRAGDATWHLIAKDGFWGTADWYNNAVYISPAVPASKIYDVVTHEWSHLLSVRPYDSVAQATDAMNAYFGGTGVTGAERAADCMARQLGARWTHYTSCTDARWRAGAAKLLARQRL